MSLTAHDVPYAYDLVNALPCPEIACYQRDAGADGVTVTYAIRGALESLWQGVIILDNGTDTTEARTGPQTTPEGAIAALATVHRAMTTITPMHVRETA